ncbi:MAG: prolyl oligopeptidase family serine peptidase [Chitinivibrionales bacterium]|nr:prolyl oligopeptidase family serine peptidase [Chitinivibrionales bacterium]
MKWIIFGIIALILVLTMCNRSAIFNLILQSRFNAVVFNDVSPHAQLPYRLFIPDTLSLRRYPLVVILHGGAERGSDNKKQLTVLARKFSSKKVQKPHPCFIVAPQCPTGKQWVNTPFKRTPFNNYEQDKIPESREMQLVMALCKDLIDHHPIDADRIYVIGYSMGGSGTWDIVTRYPRFFAAASPITGVSDTSKTDRITHLPLWAFHGSKDHITPVDVTKRTIASLRSHGSTVCKFTEYPDRGHISWVDKNDEQALIDWFFSQSRVQ